jgi:hypothetical protein
LVEAVVIVVQLLGTAADKTKVKPARPPTQVILAGLVNGFLIVSQTGRVFPVLSV